MALRTWDLSQWMESKHEGAAPPGQPRSYQLPASCQMSISHSCFEQVSALHLKEQRKKQIGVQLPHRSVTNMRKGFLSALLTMTTATAHNTIYVITTSHLQLQLSTSPLQMMKQRQGNFRQTDAGVQLMWQSHNSVHLKLSGTLKKGRQFLHLNYAAMTLTFESNSAITPAKLSSLGHRRLICCADSSSRFLHSVLKGRLLEGTTTSVG